jgi:hypothetical protein
MDNDQWFKDKGKYIQQMRKKRFPNDTQQMFATSLLHHKPRSYFLLRQP